MNKELQSYYDEIDQMSDVIGESKQMRLKAYVNQAYRKGKLSQVNLLELSKGSRKSIVLAKKEL